MVQTTRGCTEISSLLMFLKDSIRNSLDWSMWLIWKQIVEPPSNRFHKWAQILSKLFLCEPN